MSIDALKKAAASSKVLLFLVFVVAATVALQLGMVDKAWYQETVARSYYLLMAGYSIVEAARAVYTGKVVAADMLVDPKAALNKAFAEMRPVRIEDEVKGVAEEVVVVDTEGGV